MNWMCYLLIYCGMCYLVFICIYVYNMWKGKDIIDEEPFISSQMSHVVLTEPETGLTKELAVKAIELLL